MRFIIIGGGSIGKRHLRNLLSLGESDIAVVEQNAERMSAIAAEFNIKTFSSMRQAFESETFECAFICSPSRFHQEQALYCADHKCDLFIEKPLSHTMDGIFELKNVIEKNKLITMVGSNFKFYPSLQKIKSLLDAGAIGKILSARLQFGQYLPDWHPWEDYRQGYSANERLGGGVLLDSHEFDYATWLLGDVSKVTCVAKKISDLEIDVEDVAAVILHLKSGALVELHLDYVQRFYSRCYEFFGETGTIMWDIKEKKVLLKTKEAGEQIFELISEYDFNTMYIDELKHFLACVEARSNTVSSVIVGARVLEIITAAKESSLKEKTIEV